MYVLLDAALWEARDVGFPLLVLSTLIDHLVK